MKKNTLLLLISFLSFIIVDAQAQEWCAEGPCCYEESCFIHETNFYAKLLSGANLLQNTSTDGNEATYQTGYIIAGSLGYYWNCGLSLEAEYAYRRNSIKNIDFFIDESSDNGYYRSSSYMANLLWDLPLSSWGYTFWNFQPFIGAGIGYDFKKLHASNSSIIFNQKFNGFSWQLKTGFIYPIFSNAEMTLEYAFHQGGSDFYNHTIGVGFIYKFDCRSFSRFW